MFDFGSGELVVIGVVALVAIGPKELPGLLRTVGQMVGKMRRMAGDFQNQFNEAMREADMAEAQKLISDIKTDFSAATTSETTSSSGSMSPTIAMRQSYAESAKDDAQKQDEVKTEEKVEEKSGETELTLEPVEAPEPVGDLSATAPDAVAAHAAPVEAAAVSDEAKKTQAGAA